MSGLLHLVLPTASSVSNWRYYNSPEDGARQTKGWFKVVAASSDNDNTFDEDQTTSFAQTHANDESEKWYYAGDKWAFCMRVSLRTSKVNIMHSGRMMMQVRAAQC